MFKKQHPIYSTWCNIMARCYKPYATHFDRYGGRGITVCDRWHDFWLFASDVGEKPTPQHTIDRIDNDGPYHPDNWQWATRAEQQKTTHWALKVVIDGEEIRAADIARSVGVTARTIKNRADRGLSIDQIMSPDKLHAPIKRHVVEKAWAKRRAQTHCKRGHEFTPENTYIDKKGCRCCRVCINAKSQAWRDKIRSQGFDPSKPAALRKDSSNK